VAACATSCRTLPVTPPIPAASTMSPSWEQVEAPGSCLRWRWATAPRQQQPGVVAAASDQWLTQPAAASSGCRRSSR
jgi:hypothetical protein